MNKTSNNFPTNLYNDQYSSLIRPIKIFLPSGKKGTKDDGSEYDDFVGRERLMERLFNWLSDKRDDKGSYLVTGFRGMGKTKLVERVTGRLTREVNEKSEPWWLAFSMFPVFAIGLFFAFNRTIKAGGTWFWIVSALLSAWLIVSFFVHNLNQNHYKRKAARARRRYPNHSQFDKTNVDKMVRGKKDDYSERQYNNIRISINLGHEVLMERDVLSLIATSVKDKYKEFVRSIKPHLIFKSLRLLFLSLVTVGTIAMIQSAVDTKDTTSGNVPAVSIEENNVNSRQIILAGRQENAGNQQVVVNGNSDESWFSRTATKVEDAICYAYVGDHVLGTVFRFVVYLILILIYGWVFGKLFHLIPFFATPVRALRRLATLTERLNTITGEETGISPTANNSYISLTLFNRRKHKTRPIADIREIETELADIINMINSDKCFKPYRARFIVVFDEMDKIDPAIEELARNNTLPEYTDAVKGFPEGLESRERRRNVLKLLANIKLFVSTAKAKFVFISGRELYDAYLADLSDRDFAISSIFSGVINVDSFLTPEGGQTDVRSMSEWYITNRLIPRYWLEEVEQRNAKGQLKGEISENESRAVLKKELPSLRWYFEYLIEKCNVSSADATYVIGFLHNYAAYLTHISNGSPKKIFLYFEKYIRLDKDCVPLNDWHDTLTVGEPYTGRESRVLYFDSIQQKTINFVYYLANPIMGTITNDLSNYGDRFLVSLSFIIDHIYKHHNRSFSWRNLEQIPDLLKTSKAPDLRGSMMSIMEYLTQTHISPILIGLNEYKFHKSISEEISVMSKMSDEASAIFNFTLDESLSVIQHNTRLLNHYLELDRTDPENNSGHRQYIPIIARIHSNLGDLHFWDEDFYAASLEYRAAVDAFSRDETVSGFLTRIRCMLKLGLTYESRKLFPNAYQLYCQLMELLIKKRWVDEKKYGLEVMDQYVDDWRGKKNVLVAEEPVYGMEPYTPSFKKQFLNEMVEDGDDKRRPLSINVDGMLSSFAADLTEEKTATINSLTLFEEVRYVYQAILAKLSVLEKMGISGITQTNIDVAEGEFKAIHKSVNIKEKFIISADFFKKLAEILYYKNSLDILTPNQDSLYVSVYYDDYDLLANLDDYCRYEVGNNLKMNGDVEKKNAVDIHHDVELFFDLLDSPASSNIGHPFFNYDVLSANGSYCELYEKILEKVGDYLDEMECNKLFGAEDDKERMRKNVEGYLNYNINTVKANKSLRFYHNSVQDCDFHSRKMREQSLRTPCYACKYYTRSLRILADNMIGGNDFLANSFTRSYSILKKSFKHNLLYSSSNHIRILAQTLEGYGNVMLACASGNNLEGLRAKKGCGINANLVKLIIKLFECSCEDDELRAMDEYEAKLKGQSFSRLDKSILYFYDAYRFYLMDSGYSEAANCLNRIINLFAYYIEVLCYYNGGEDIGWNKREAVETVKAIVGDSHFRGSIMSILFSFVVRHTGYKYDLTNLAEISELKWVYSKDIRDNIDLTRLSLYPAYRSTWLRIIEIRAKGLSFLQYNSTEYNHIDYLDFIKMVYPLIAPKDRYRTTFYEETMGYYTKIRFNDHILNEIFDGNPMLDSNTGKYDDMYHVQFYRKMADFLESPKNNESLDCRMFETNANIEKRLELVEYLILDTLVCITNMVKIFVPHNNLSTYSNSFIGIVYNYYWEWSHKYEFVYNLYLYDELILGGRKEEAERIIAKMAGSSSLTIHHPEKESEVADELRREMGRCRKVFSKVETSDSKEKYGTRSERLYGQLRHDVDDITINNIFSNYTAEMALKYYQMAEETNTEGKSYKEMLDSMYFLDDDMNNDTNQFNLACDRFLLNCGVVRKQRNRLDSLYKYSNAYHLRKSHIEGPNNLRKEEIDLSRFDRSQFNNSEY